MPHLFGRHMTRRELAALTGDMSQVAGIRMLTLADGAESGVRIADIRTGSGLRFQVTLDRGMDIGPAEYRGVPLAFRSPAGDVHPSRFEPAGRLWARTFPGGLMTGCGMTSVGSPGPGGDPPQHGRLSHMQAREVSTSRRWEGDECTFTVSGTMRETAMFGENVVLERSIVTRMGVSEIAIRDIVRNEGTERAPLMMLYHINTGWPLLDPGAAFLVSSGAITPRDADAAAGLALAHRSAPPRRGFAEQVFYHDPVPDAGGRAAAMLRNDALGLGLCVSFRTKELPRLVQWKMMGEGSYVMGIEPANCGVAGREAERSAGTLRTLGPGEEQAFDVVIGIADGEVEISSFIARHGLT